MFISGPSALTPKPNLHKPNSFILTEQNRLKNKTRQKQEPCYIVNVLNHHNI